jgi:DNA-binding transcriptional ArsR family regulator
MNDKINGKFYPLNNQEWERAWQELKPAEIRILYHLRTLDPWGEREMELGVSSLARDLKLDKGTVSRALRSLAEKGWIDPNVYGLKLNNQDRIESQIRDSLKSQLGGLTEVKTPAGRIDLLTETEIVEVKRICDWKSALGQVLAYSAFYPEHRKRLHLFGSAKDEGKIADIANSCLAFEVSIGFEVVVGVES